MATSKQQIGDWFENGLTNKQDFMIVVCDTYDWTDYPSYCKKDEFDLKYKQYSDQNMQQVMEVYDLSLDKDSQLNQHRCMNLPKKEDKSVSDKLMSSETQDSICMCVWCFVSRDFATYVNRKEEQYNGRFDWSKFHKKMKERIPDRLAVTPFCSLSKVKKKRADQLVFAGNWAETVATELITTAGFLEVKND